MPHRDSPAALGPAGYQQDHPRLRPWPSWHLNRHVESRGGYCGVWVTGSLAGLCVCVRQLCLLSLWIDLRRSVAGAATAYPAVSALAGDPGPSLVLDAGS